MEPVLVANGLRRRFGDVNALDGLSLEVLPGELYGLVGPDGAGKTTTMRIFAGLMDPDEGTVHVLGSNPTDRRSGVREELGYMPQQYSLYGDLSVIENLRFFGALFCLERDVFIERTNRLLAITHLESFRDRRAEALSGGMYKKLALACALLHQPRVLLLDEPTNGVDPISRGELWELLYEFVESGMGVVVSTPYMDEASMCHRVGLIHRGRLLQQGRPADLVGRFVDTVIRVDRHDSGIEAVIAEHGDVILGVSPLGGGLRIVIRSQAADAVAEALRGAGATIEPVRPGFEDMFLSEIRAGGGT
ncbi:MAG: ABC transporter ATP-binding protein [Deltaproteobacteria bacterium]|nr:ABC transporter ATP-binding protein [Deltaproteobacteria bacterium]